MQIGTHGLCAAATWIWLCRSGMAPEAEVIGLWSGVPLAVLGGALPDIDHPRSWLGRRLPWLSLPLAAVIGHRGLTHSLLAIAGISAGGEFVRTRMVLAESPPSAVLLLPLLAGYLSHILMDAITPAGVPLLWPWRRRFGIPLVRSGGVIEWGIGISCASAMALMLLPQ